MELTGKTKAATSSGGSSSTPTYPPTIPKTEGGKASVSPGNPKRSDTVAVTPTPDKSYEVGNVVVKDRNSNELEVKDNGEWYTEAIRWAASEGIVYGYDDGKFGPDDPITREQLAVIFYRYEQRSGGGFTGDWMFNLDFTDAADMSDWAYEAICWCSMNGILRARATVSSTPRARPRALRLPRCSCGIWDSKSKKR